jgi:hypothetical protein
MTSETTTTQPRACLRCVSKKRKVRKGSFPRGHIPEAYSRLNPRSATINGLLVGCVRDQMSGASTLRASAVGKSTRSTYKPRLSLRASPLIKYLTGVQSQVSRNSRKTASGSSRMPSGISSSLTVCKRSLMLAAVKI